MVFTPYRQHLLYDVAVGFSLPSPLLRIPIFPDKILYPTLPDTFKPPVLRRTVNAYSGGEIAYRLTSLMQFPCNSDWCYTFH